MRRERDAYAAELRRQAGQRVVKAARRLLADLAGADLEQLVVRRFLARLGALGEGEREALRAGREATVRAAFPLPAAVRRQVEEAVRALLGGEAAVRLETDPALICGVEVEVAGRRWRWSVDGYLDDLEEALDGCLAGAGGV